MALTDAEIDSLLEGSASGFRHCVIASPGCCLIEADYSALEAILTGYFANDPTYYRLAKFGVHAYLTSHLVGRPADLTWDDATLKRYLDEMKISEGPTYEMAKRVVHGTNYGLTPFGMAERFPSTFPSKAIAERIQNLYFTLAPKLRAWQLELQARAAKQHYIGGPGQHPFGYKHWFWDVHNYKRIDRERGEILQRTGKPVRCYGDTWFQITLGEDAKRVISFPPQSTGAAISRLCGLRLFAPIGEPRAEAFGDPYAFAESYIGDLYYGATPLRAYIYDSFVLEVPIPARERAIAALLTEMRRPVAEMPLPWSPGEFVTLDAAVKTGLNWAPADDTNPDGMRKWKPSEAPSEAALDTIVDPMDDEDDEDEGEEEE